MCKFKAVGSFFIPSGFQSPPPILKLTTTGMSQLGKTLRGIMTNSSSNVRKPSGKLENLTPKLFNKNLIDN